MSNDLKDITEHDLSDACTVCQAQGMVEVALIPAASAWEMAAELPRYSIALHGAAGLLGAMLEGGVPRHELERTLGELLDDIEQQITEDTAMGGPPQGNA